MSQSIGRARVQGRAMPRLVCICLMAFCTLVACGSTGTRASQAAPDAAVAGATLLQKANLVYAGAFRVPQGSGENVFNYGGTALGFNPVSNSLILTGHDWYQRSAEISIPTPVNTTDIDSLPRATLMQGFRDPFEGRLGQINPGDPNSKKTGGHLIYDGHMYVTGWSYYDGAGTQRTSHFRRPLSLASTGQVVGPEKVGSLYPGFVCGFMTLIPAEWRTAFGGPVLTGHGGASIQSIQSNGPAASVFDPAQIGVKNPVPAMPVVGYPYKNSLANQYRATETGAANPYWSATSQVRGAVFPDHTRSLLFFGSHGTGAYCYGTGSAQRGGAGGKSGKSGNSDTGDDCYDPADGNKGSHAWPYAYQVWAYDANDLLAVKNGTKQQYRIKPYAVWTFTLPFSGGRHALGGAAYDPVTKRIYLSQLCQDTDCAPIIHSFKVTQ